MLIDTHSHIYDAAFDGDRDEAVEAAQRAGVRFQLLPAIDSDSYGALFDTARRYEGYCLPMIGLHPTSVGCRDDNERQLRLVERCLESPPMRIYGIGEVGLDLYWSQEREKEQIEVLCRQIELALRYDLPLSVHTRNAMEPMLDVLSGFSGRGLRGVMHAFSGTVRDCERIKSCGDFLFGVGGTVTYKNGTAPFVEVVDLSDMVLETDCPYLPPVPFRGRRNQSAYIVHVCEAVARIKNIEAEQVAEITSRSAASMFGIQNLSSSISAARSREGRSEYLPE